jgi:hypothetical protein
MCPLSVSICAVSCSKSVIFVYRPMFVVSLRPGCIKPLSTLTSC